MHLRMSLRESLAAETETMRVSDRIPRSMSCDIRRGRLNTDPPAPVATGQTNERHRVPQSMLCTGARSRRIIHFGQHAGTTVPLTRNMNAAPHFGLRWVENPVNRVIVKIRINP